MGSVETQIVTNLISNEQSLVGAIGELVSGIEALEAMSNYTSSMSGNMDSQDTMPGDVQAGGKEIRPDEIITRAIILTQMY